MKGLVFVLFGTAFIPAGVVFAQTGQAHYVGTNVTGQIVLARTVSLHQVAGQPQGTLPLAAYSGTTSDAFFSTSAFFSGFGTSNASVKERLPKIPPRRWLPSTLSVGPQMLGSPGKAGLARTAAIPVTQTLSVNPSFTGVGFNGMTHLDQREANNGNQFSVEPPNPAIAVANGYVVEGVNNAFQVYSTSGTPLLPRVLSTNELFGVPAAIDWSTGINGVFPTDMRAFYDHDIDRWIVLQRAQDYDISGNPLNQSHLYMAVSQSGDPTGTYNIYVMETTDAQVPGCPCVADYPQIGADRYGFYISTNGFNTFSERFVRASILAISKDSLGSGATTPTAYRFLLPFTTGYEFAIQPASTPPRASYFVGNGGLEYFVSSQGTSSFSNTLAVWAMYNTASLRTSTPSLLLTQRLVPSLAYAFPDVATQRPGPLPYGSTLSPPGLLSFIDGGDMRVLSASYAAGRLWVTLSTNSTDVNGRTVVGAAYLILSPTFRAGVLAAPVLRHGYLVTTNNHILRPAIAVDAQGRGAIAFTLVGPDYHPSAAFVPIDLLSTASVMQVPAFGAMPQDGFTGYPGGFGAGVARWGDYSSAVAAGDGSIWMTAEYIPNAPRTEFANWGTFLYRYIP
jgi:hypothetical protein